MKIKVSIVFCWGLMALSFLFSCKKESEQQAPYGPTVTIMEVGTGNSKIAYAGADLHIEADIVAPAKIVSIKVQITLSQDNYGWDFVNTYTNSYAGAKNAEFHEHVDVPPNARAGKYTLLIVVTDENGVKGHSKVEFEVVRDPELPSISNHKATVTTSTMLNVSGSIKAAKKIEKVVVEVQSSAWTREFTFTDVSMVNQIAYEFNKSIDVAGSPAGHYHVNTTVFDQTGKKITASVHLDK